MPIYLEPCDVTADLESFSSVLIVSCPICPPMCVSMQQKKPFIEFFKHGLKSQAFEEYIRSIRKPLEQRGIRTGEFIMHMPIPMMCLWTRGQRNRLLRRAKGYDAVVVLGCNSATYTAKDTLKETGCQFFQAMRVETITNAVVKFRFPLTVELMALAISVTSFCEGCIAHHVYDVLKAGATEEEIAETLGIAVLMGGGTSVVYATYTLEAVEQFLDKAN